jgi:hypothetical protein
MVPHTKPLRLCTGGVHCGRGFLLVTGICCANGSVRQNRTWEPSSTLDQEKVEGKQPPRIQTPSRSKHRQMPSDERAEPAKGHDFWQNERGLFEASVPIDFFEFIRW